MLDIETVERVPFDSLTETMQAYLTRRKVGREKLALEPGLNRIVAVGVHETGIAMGTGTEVYLAAEVAMLPDDGCRWHTYREEAALLRALWRRLPMLGTPRIVTYNGRTFDGPTLTMRSLQLGIVPAINLGMTYRYSADEHADLCDVLSNYGAGSMRSFAYWCDVLDVPNPKASMDGSAVGERWAAGDYVAVGEYVRDDVLALAQLWAKVRPMLKLKAA